MPSRIRPASFIPAVVDPSRPRLADRTELVPSGAELLEVLVVGGEPEYPLVEPPIETLGFPADLVPCDVELVVSVVVALRVTRMARAGLLDHRVDDHAGDHRAVRVGADHGLVDDLLADHDDSIRGER